jgi:serine/threonine protein kinase
MSESGARVGGWTLDWQLGGGAGGEVFRCRHDDGRVAAIKLARPGTEARLVREAELLAAVGHDAFPAFIERVDSGYVMELVAGRSLAAVARAWSAEVSLSLLGQLADALAALHARGWVHRDVAIGNLLVENGGRLRVLDLGAAGPAGGGDLTAPGRAVGARRQPPEGPVTTPARDAWTVGALWHELWDDAPPAGRLRDVLEGLREPDPARRATLASVAAALADVARLPVALSRTLGASGPVARPAATQLGRYLLLEEIGRGAMGVVFRAWDPMLQRAVAVKTAAGGDGERLVREARAVGALDHPAICRVFDAGIEDGVPWLAMELLPGGTVAGLVTASGLAPDRAVALVHAVAGGLAAAHRAGLIHRDVKPSNLLLDETGAPRLSDFGLVTRGEPSDLTQRGVVVGTLRYMAPEQARGEPASRATDVYSLGVVLYELLSGRTPYDDHDLVAFARRGVEPGRPLRAHRAVDPDLDGVVARAVAFDPADRYPDADAFAEDLGRRRRGEPVRALPPSRVRQARWWARRHAAALRATAITIAAVALAAGAVVGWRALAARREAARLERQAEASMRLAERVVEARRATDPAGAASLFDEIARGPGLQGTVALAEAWLREAARRDQPAARAQALARAWLATPASRHARVLREIADGHAEAGALDRRAATARLVDELGLAVGGPDPLVRDGALARRHLAHPKVADDAALGPILTAWAVGARGEVPAEAPWTEPMAPRTFGDVTWITTPTGFVRRQDGVSREVPVAFARLAVDIESPLEADLDGDGAPEIIFHTSFWRGWELRVVDGRSGEPRARMRWGSARLGAIVRAAGRELAVVQSTRQFGSKIVFPAGSPYGRPTGVALVGLDGDRFVLVWSMATEASTRPPLVGDLDGDGLDDVVVATVTGMVVIRQLAGGRFAGAWIGGVSPRALGQLDDDRALELSAVVDGAGWHLGAGAAPVPPMAGAATVRSAERDPALRRALELAAIGLEDEAVAGLAAIRAVEGDSARGARAALLQATLTPGADADALYALAAAHPAVTADAVAAAAAAEQADGRFGDELDLDLRGPLAPAWRVDSATGVRWRADRGGQRVEAGSHQALLRLPVEVTADRVRLELDATIELTEWASQLRVEITDDAGRVQAMSLLPSRGGRQAVRVGLVCRDEPMDDTVVFADAPRPRLTTPWWMAVADGTTRCGLGRAQGLPKPGAVARGPAWIVIAGSSDEEAVARMIVRGLRLWGMRARAVAPPDPAALARWRLARLEPTAALAHAPGGVEGLVARLELGLPVDDALAARWREAPDTFALLLRSASPVVAAWVRAHHPEAWPALWWRAYGDDVWQHPDDPEVRAVMIDQLPDALAVAPALPRREGAVLLTMRGRALRRAGALAAAEAHQDAALATLRAALAATAAATDQAELHDVLALVTTERAALALARGDRDGAMAACRDGLAIDPLPEYLADGLGDHPELAALRERADFRALLAAVPGWEGAHLPR